MSYQNLKERVDSYIELSNFKLLQKLPVIFLINGKGFSKITSRLDKPYCDKFAECLQQTMLQLCSELEGVFFGYCFNDEIVLISRNDQTIDTAPLFDNKIQKLASIASSLATLYFNIAANNAELELTNSALFYTNVFTVPTLYEAVNTVISRQQKNLYLSIQFACFYELLKTREKEDIKNLLNNLSLQEKIDLLQSECDVTFSKYNKDYRFGAACYKVPKMINDNVKTKWSINKELPIFSKDQSFLTNIFKFGQDIFRG